MNKKALIADHNDGTAESCLPSDPKNRKKIYGGDGLSFPYQFEPVTTGRVPGTAPDL